MTSPTEEFFNELGRRRYEPRLGRATGSVRIELVEGVCTEHWYVEINEGEIVVSRDNAEADAVFRAERGLFDRAAAGEENLMAALLRGAVSAEGELELAVRLNALLPGPPSSTARRRAAGTERRSAA
ncbi:MAG TPA: SCP2 sterol-binding domain-containing protein [Rugosimonospora sp.]|nr:SCP2 sterol-binding domain-containing protein [Rugosimonospora sp.]